jgi:hypothetical protein
MTAIDNVALCKAAPLSRGNLAISSNASRLMLIILISAAIVSGFLMTGRETSSLAVINAGEDLTRLLRAMAALKAIIAVCAASAIVWRLGSDVSTAWFAAYALACCAMGAGPGLIWSMAHVGTGALLLHGGLLASLLLFWRDPAVSERLSAIITARRNSINGTISS